MLPPQRILMALLVSSVLPAASCLEPADASLGEETQPVAAPGSLTAPAPFVLDDDGVTHLSLEDAGIYKRGGTSWSVVLGKALFWDEQVGSDGTACASCHFHAGADIRRRNPINPGSNDVSNGPGGDSTFGSVRSDTGDVAPAHMPSGALAESNYLLQSDDFPPHQLSDETDHNSPVVTTTNDRVSSPGIFDRTFVRVGGNSRDVCDSLQSSPFHAGAFAARQVEPRNTPTAHNAVFNFRNFWDNRANNLFNGVGPFGLRDVMGEAGNGSDPRNNNRLVVLENGTPTLTYLEVENASLASQAVDLPLSAIEMSCGGRRFADIGRKLLLRRPLRHQHVSRYDSVLGRYASLWQQGLRGTYRYRSLIKRTFDPKYWALPGRYRIEGGHLISDPGGYTQMELNFSMFFGLALAEYEAILVSDKSEFDQLQASGRLVMTPSFVPAGPAIGVCNSPTGDVDPLLVRGCTIFARLNPSPFLPTPPDGIRGGNCFVCHNAPAGGVGRDRQPLLTEGAVQEGESMPLFLTVRDINRINDLRDNGSSTRGTFRKLEADGSAKIPILRNVGLTPPYFSWGGYPTLRQVIKVYNRAMNRRDIPGLASLEAHGSNCVTGDDSGAGPDGNQSWPVQGDDCNTNTTGLIVPLGLSDCDANGVGNAACSAAGQTTANDDIAALARFMRSFTDRRVQCDQAPFDHPQLQIRDGHAESDTRYTGEADDIVFNLPAIGAYGYSPNSGFCIPNSGDLFAPGMQARAGGSRVPLP